MPGAILENLSGRKLAVLTSILLLGQLLCFLIGGLIAPAPSRSQAVLETLCVDWEGKGDDVWFWPHGTGGCDSIHSLDDDRLEEHNIQANQVVFSYQMPHRKDGQVLDYTRWQQTLIGILQVDIEYAHHNQIVEDATLSINARLGYRNKGDDEGDWKHLASSVEERKLDCSIEEKREGYLYNCSLLPLFELGSLHHDFYLLNLRLPIYEDKGTNVGLGKLVDMWVVTIYQNGGFTKVWVSMKTVFLPLLIIVMVWFWHRVRLLSRPPALLEYMLLGLGSALTILNLPLEFLTLYFDIPYMLLIGDVRQGLFYAMLLSFWLIFAGEHLMISDDMDRNRLKAYWRHLSAVATGCLCLFVFDMCERGVQLKNPFYTIWATSLGTNIALTFIIIAGISAGLYFMFLSWMIWKVFRNISEKRRSLPSMSSLRRMHYEGIIYRFKFLMLATLLCAAMTVIGFILGQVAEGQWKWDEDINVEYTSAFFTGVYGMWNIYTIALICLYAPSHKRWPIEEPRGSSSTNEEIEFSRLPTEPSEISSLSSFAKKASTD